MNAELGRPIRPGSAASLTLYLHKSRIRSVFVPAVSLTLEGLVMSLVKIIVITIIVILTILLFGRFFS